MNDVPAPDPLLGKVLAGKWRVEALLGSGGMAKVYAAEHRNGHKVAIKVLNPELSAVAEARERFLREGYAANHIEHPGVVPVLDDDVMPNGTAFLVMERLVGRTLDARIPLEPKLTVREALFVTSSVLDVLARAHERGIVHRDVKPENIFLTMNGDVRVLDFGIARVRSASLQQKNATESGTFSGGIMGTPAFMAPEQARGHFDEVDGRSDVFSLGMVLWSTLAGRQARQATSVNEVLFQAMSHTVPSIATVLPEETPAELITLVDRATAVERESRWGSAEEMRDALVEVWQSLGFGESLSLDDDDSLVGPNVPPLDEKPSGQWPDSMPVSAKTVRLEDIPGALERFSSLPPPGPTSSESGVSKEQPGTLDPWLAAERRSHRRRLAALTLLVAAGVSVLIYSQTEPPASRIRRMLGADPPASASVSSASLPPAVVTPSATPPTPVVPTTTHVIDSQSPIQGAQGASTSPSASATASGSTRPPRTFVPNTNANAGPTSPDWLDKRR